MKTARSWYREARLQIFLERDPIEENQDAAMKPDETYSPSKQMKHAAVLCLPTAAEGAVELHETLILVATRLR